MVASGGCFFQHELGYCSLLIWGSIHIIHLDGMVEFVEFELLLFGKSEVYELFTCSSVNQGIFFNDLVIEYEQERDSHGLLGSLC